MRANAYLDAGTKAGLGVCKGSVKDDDFGAPQANKCYRQTVNAAGDDNMQANEVLGFVFDSAKKISDVGIWGSRTILCPWH